MVHIQEFPYLFLEQVGIDKNLSYNVGHTKCRKAFKELLLDPNSCWL